MLKSKFILLFCALIISKNVLASGDASGCLIFEQVSSDDWQKMASGKVARNACSVAINAWWCSQDKESGLRCPNGGESQIGPYGKSPAFVGNDLFPKQVVCFAPKHPNRKDGKCH